MPVYEYACDKCGHEFEAEQRISDEPIRTCPKCRARKVKRLISRTSFVLKGSGWYSDLYSSNGKSDSKGDAKSKDESGGDASRAQRGEAERSPSDKAAASDAKTETKSEQASEVKPAKADTAGKSKAKGKSKAA
jgi:putative FmdB family regulatory protein